MPIFEYSCSSCGHHFEKLQKAGTEPETKCPACGSAEVRKEISTFSGGSASPSSASCFSGG